MNDNEIVRRLMENSRRHPIFSKEALTEDEDEDMLDDIDNDEDIEDEDDIEEIETEDTPEREESPASAPSISSNPRRSAPAPSEGGDSEETKQIAQVDTPDENEYVNPLDNQYAVKHGLGDDVVLAYADGKLSTMKGIVDGYDPEGFYRIKWEGGFTTNGITDIALADLVKATNESVCICGSSEFITEGNSVVCDSCGRKIRDNVEDNLTKLDKARPKGKKMIRSTPHPISTATRPNISETIKSALKNR